MLQLGLLLLYGVIISGRLVSGNQSTAPRASAACPLTITAKKDDTCTSVASANGISVSQFIQGNPELTNCRLTEGKTYCVDTTIKSEPPSALTPSLDGTCGLDKGTTCLGSAYGDCCSKNGYCGKEDVYCGAGCQPTFGLCGANRGAGSSPPSPPLSSSSSSKCEASPYTVTTTQKAPYAVTTTEKASYAVTTTEKIPYTMTTTEKVTILREIYSVDRVTVTATTTLVSTSVSTLVVDTWVYLPGPTVTLTETKTSTTTSTISSTFTSTFTSTRVSAIATRTISTTQIITTTLVSVAKPSPTLLGTNRNCNLYHYTDNWDTCSQIARTYGITLAELRTWNPGLNCGYQSNIAGYYLCVGIDTSGGTTDDICSNTRGPNFNDSPTVCFYSHATPSPDGVYGYPQSNCPLAAEPSARIYTVPGTNLTFARTCDSENSGNDLGIFPTQTMEDCLALCAQLNLYPSSLYGPCQGVTWVYGEGRQGEGANFCFPKWGVTATLYRDGTESALLWI